MRGAVPGDLNSSVVRAFGYRSGRWLAAAKVIVGVGHSLVKARMDESDAALAAERSGAPLFR